MTRLFSFNYSAYQLPLDRSLISIPHPPSPPLQPLLGLTSYYDKKERNFPPKLQGVKFQRIVIFKILNSSDEQLALSQNS
jgi:hypothetical protein